MQENYLFKIMKFATEKVAQNQVAISPVKVARLYHKSSQLYARVFLDLSNNQDNSNMATYRAIKVTFEYIQSFLVTYCGGQKIDGSFLCDIFKDSYFNNLAQQKNPAIKRRSKIALERAKDNDCREMPICEINKKYPFSKEPNDKWYGTNFLSFEVRYWKTTFVERKSFLATPIDIRQPQYDSEIVKMAEAVTTPYQRETVLKWAGGHGTSTPSGLWLNIYMDKAKMYSKEKSEREWAIEMRNYNLAIYNTFLIVWHNKTYYMSQRPLQHAERLGIVGFNTIIPTPPFPGYISGHSTVSKVASCLIGGWYPESYEDVKFMSQEASDSRIFGRIHILQDCVQGQNIGQALYNKFIKSFEEC